jgi:hypothetical protein
MAVIANKPRISNTAEATYLSPKGQSGWIWSFESLLEVYLSTQIKRNKFWLFPLLQDYRHFVYYTKVLDIIVNKAVLFIYAINFLYRVFHNVLRDYKYL